MDKSFLDERFRAQQLESFQEVIPIAVLYCQPILQQGQVTDFRYVWGNRMAHQLSALSPDEFGQMTMLTLFPSFVDSGIFNRYRQAWETGNTQRFERQHPIGDLIRWVDVSVSKKYDGLVITAVDITESKQAQQALERQTQLLQNIVEQLPVGLALFHPVRQEDGEVIDFRYELTNPANARTIGLSVDQLLNHNLLEAYPAALEQGTFGRLKEVLHTGIPKHYQTLYHINGVDLWLEGHMAQTEDGVLLTYLDNTLLRRQQQTQLEQACLFQQKNEQLHEVNEALTRTNQRLQGLQAIERALLNRNLTAQGPKATALRHTQQLVPCERLVVFRFDEATGLAGAKSWIDDKEMTVRVSSSLPVDLFKIEPLLNEQPIVVDNILDTPQDIPAELASYDQECRSMIVVPLFSQQQYIGAFVLMAYTPHFFTAEYLQIAQEVGSQLAIVLGEQLLHEQLQQHTEQLEQRVAERTQAISQLSRLQNAILKHAGQAIISTDIQGVVLSANPAVEQVLGYGADELIGRHPQARFDPSASAVPILSYQAARLGSTPPFLMQPILQKQDYFQMECLLEGKNGKQVPVLLTTSTLQDEAGTITGYVGMATDISSLKAAERELQEKSRELTIFFEGALDLYCITTGDGIFLKVNRAWTQTLGYQVDELEGQPLVKWIHPDDQTESSLIYQQSLIDGFVNRYRHKDGSYRLIQWRANRFEDFVYASARDITEQKQAEEALRESEQRFREIAENVDEVFWIHSVQPFELLYINPAYERVFGIASPNDTSGARSFLDTILDEDRSRVMAEFEKYRQGQEVTVQCRVQGTHQSIRWLQVRTFIMNDNRGVPLRYIGIANDITSQKEKELVLQQSLQREQELNQLKSQFVSTASHEFRTPLTTIQTSVDLIDLYLDHPPESARPIIQNYLGVIREQIQNVNELLSDILSIGKIEAGKIAFNPEWGDLLALCQQVIATHFSHQVDQRIVRISVQGTPCPIYFEEKLMGHVLINLLSNAFKFSETDPQLTIRFQESDVVIQIIDEGIGIPAIDLPTLFQTFFRARNTAAIPGTGLGLVIARQFIALHGGRLTVQSEEHVGTTFTIVLPIQPNRQVLN
ncbi:PAS domain S-box protein [Spirosoma sp. HMF4905]|uniref:histidine kinase n=1 Tax=Spirosoma arboris TaxID=2682092 RepID=A0A7K1S8S4_9BACT|nr:PAS domain S-box protein [Spirosoma arboris]MVM30155.1 PAS domain S-box protein [Spirosoma arboris]